MPVKFRGLEWLCSLGQFRVGLCPIKEWVLCSLGVERGVGGEEALRG